MRNAGNRPGERTHVVKSYCLTVEVESAHIKGGIGYMIAFSLPDDDASPSRFPELAAWKEDVKKIVLRTGDMCFYPDAYTKKLAIAGMVDDLLSLNRKYSIKISSTPQAPAVQIHSTNPFDPVIEIDFDGSGAGHRTCEKDFSDLHRPTVSRHGKTSLTAATRKYFPFRKNEAAPPAKTPPAGRPPLCP